MRNSFLIWFRRVGFRGFHFLWSLIAPKDGLLLCNGKHQVKYLVDPYEYIDNSIIRDRGYETEVAEKAAEILPENSVVWDIGANIGTFALPLKRLRADVKLVCFEPNLAIAARLLRNSRLNQLAIEIFPFALSSTNGLAKLFSTAGNAGMSSLINWHGTNNVSVSSGIVPTVRGDTLLERNFVPSPNLIKIDVEGAENAVLDSLACVLSNVRLHAVIFEASAPGDTAGETLKRHGFTIEPLRRQEHTQHNLENFVARRFA